MRITSLITVLLALQLINSIKTRGVADVNCGIHCALCHQKNCTQCFRRNLKKVNQKWTCSTQLAPKSQHCLVYSLHGCVRCKQGYTKLIHQGRVSYCQLSKVQIKDCLYMEKKNKEEKCNVCLNGVPSSDYKACIPFPDQDPNELENCLLGLRYYKPQVLICTRCKQGYIKLPRRRSSKLVKTCIPEFKGKIGCSSVYIDPQNNYHCQSCDDIGGYHFDGKGRDCVKN